MSAIQETPLSRNQSDGLHPDLQQVIPKMPFAVYQQQQFRIHPFASLPKHLQESCAAANFCISCALCSPPEWVLHCGEEVQLSKLRREIGLVQHLQCITPAALTQR